MSIIPTDKEVKIYTKNCLDSNSAVTVSHGGTTSYLYDEDKYTKYLTSGAKRDRMPATITIVFKVGAVETNFKINSLLLLNSNIRELKLEYYNGSAYIEHFAIDELSGNGIVVHFGDVTTSRVRITLLKTQQPNQEKSIGELIVTRLRFYISENPVAYDMNYREKRNQFELGNGERHIAYTRFATYRVAKWGARISFTMLPYQDIENMLCLKNEGEPFLIQPEAVTRPDEIFTVNWVNAFAPKYTMTYKGVGFDFTMELEEV